MIVRFCFLSIFKKTFSTFRQFHSSAGAYEKFTVTFILQVFNHFTDTLRRHIKKFRRFCQMFCLYNCKKHIQISNIHPTASIQKCCNKKEMPVKQTFPKWTWRELNYKLSFSYTTPFLAIFI